LTPETRQHVGEVVHRGQTTKHFFTRFIACAVLLASTCLAAFGQASPQSNPAAGLGKVVHSKFGGSIFGFDVDQNGSQGVLSEIFSLNPPKVLTAVETFDLKSGMILKVVERSIKPKTTLLQKESWATAWVSLSTIT
jgi:hypothetical protein